MVMCGYPGLCAVIRVWMCGCQLLKMGGPKIKIPTHLFNDAEMNPGNLITHPQSGVAGADGTNARGRRVRAGEIFQIFGF